MKEILVLSGKGGTGKTTLALNLLKKFTNKTIADVDVDAADMFIILEPDIMLKEKFYSNGEAKIDYSLCNSCGICMKHCRFSAISFNACDRQIQINENNCEVCGLCELTCPNKAISIKESEAGEMFVSQTKEGDFIHARLYPGSENSGKLVEKVKSAAKKKAENNGAEYLMEDGAPGIGCPVISSLVGIDYVIIVTEPTLSGVHDLKRLKKLLDHFNIKYGIVINKADINEKITANLEVFCKENSVTLLEKMNYSKCIVDSLNQKKYAYDECENFRQKINNIYKKVVKITAN